MSETEKDNLKYWQNMLRIELNVRNRMFQTRVRKGAFEKYLDCDMIVSGSYCGTTGKVTRDELEKDVDEIAERFLEQDMLMAGKVMRWTIFKCPKNVVYYARIIH